MWEWILYVVLFGKDIGLGESRIRLSRFRVHDIYPPPGGSIFDESNTHWITQKLDHFDPANNRTWQQRYFSSDRFFNGTAKDGPVFLMLGGEGEESPSTLYGGAWIDYGANLGTLYFDLEHRYYGASHPTNNLSTKNLRYLSSEQALADMAFFISAMNRKYSLKQGVNKWVVFGGSYSGNLAAWARLKYPNLVHAAVSSSAPLQAIVDFSGYFRVVNKVLGTYPGCSEAVHNAAAKVEQILKSENKRDLKIISKKFSFCPNINVTDYKDISSFMMSVASPFANSVQYNSDTEPNVASICRQMTNTSIPSTVDRLAKLLNSGSQGSSSCTDVSYKRSISLLSDTAWDNGASLVRSWIYQTCTEFGYFQSSSRQCDLFGDTIAVQYFIDICRDLFGPRFTEDKIQKSVDVTNAFYEGKNIQVTRVVFVQGSGDPWHVLGLTKTRYPQAPVIYIKGTSHCADMFSQTQRDPIQLKQARKSIASLIQTWLRQ